MDTRLHRPRMDHDTRCRLLLRWFVEEEECPQHDLPQYDDRCCGVLPGSSHKNSLLTRLPLSSGFSGVIHWLSATEQAPILAISVSLLSTI